MKDYKKIKIICDIDDVCWDFMGSVIRHYNLLFPDEKNLSKSDFTEWDTSKVIPKDRLDVFWDCTRYKDFWNCLIYNSPEDYEIIKSIYDKYDMYFVTATDYRNMSMKTEAFLKLFPFVDSKKVILAHDKSLIKGDIMIDDGLHNIAGFDGYTILFTQPWNKCDESFLNVEKTIELYENMKLFYWGRWMQCRVDNWTHINDVLNKCA